MITMTFPCIVKLLAVYRSSSQRRGSRHCRSDEFLVWVSAGTTFKCQGESSDRANKQFPHWGDLFQCQVSGDGHNWKWLHYPVIGVNVSARSVLCFCVCALSSHILFPTNSLTLFMSTLTKTCILCNLYITYVYVTENIQVQNDYTWV